MKYYAIMQIVKKIQGPNSSFQLLYMYVLDNFSKKAPYFEKFSVSTSSFKNFHKVSFFSQKMILPLPPSLTAYAWNPELEKPSMELRCMWASNSISQFCQRIAAGTKFMQWNSPFTACLQFRYTGLDRIKIQQHIHLNLFTTWTCLAVKDQKEKEQHKIVHWFNMIYLQLLEPQNLLIKAWNHVCNKLHESFPKTLKPSALIFLWIVSWQTPSSYSIKGKTIVRVSLLVNKKQR